MMVAHKWVVSISEWLWLHWLVPACTKTLKSLDNNGSSCKHNLLFSWDNSTESNYSTLKACFEIVVLIWTGQLFQVSIWMEKYKCKYEFISISTSFFIWERDSLHVQWGWFPSHAGKYYSSKYKLHMTMELNNLEFTDIPYSELDGREARGVIFAKPK